MINKIRNMIKRRIAEWAEENIDDIKRHNEDVALYGDYYRKTVIHDMMELKKDFTLLIIEIGRSI